jgi:pimeloyl-ACP methyl ester carboxylesterase
MSSRHESQVQVFHAIPAESGTAIVAFSARGVKPGRFQFVRLLDHVSDATKLFVSDPHASWYNAGLPGVGGTPEEIAAGIKRELDRLGATRIVTFGSSMGGYAAILFGCLLGAERAVALGPQTLLDQGLRHAPPADLDLQVSDLTPIVRGARETEIDLVAGWDDHVDIFHVQRLASLPSVRVLALRHRRHAFAKDLFREGELVPLISELLDGGTPEICQVDPQIDLDSEERIADTAYAVQRGDWKTVAERIGPVSERYPDWAGPSYDLGRALAEMEDWQGAGAAFARALRANPRWTDARAYLVSALRKQGLPAEAERAARG